MEKANFSPFQNLQCLKIKNKLPGGDALFKGGATSTDKKNQLSNTVAMGDNGHLQP